jgi:hypothetical protein
MILAALALAGWLAPAADCPASAEADKAFIAAQVAHLKALAPPLPKGWKLYDTRQTLPNAAQSECGKAGAPNSAPVRVEYEITALPENAPQFRIRELKNGTAANSKASAPSIQKATQDLQDASRSRDMEAIKKANAEMQEAMAALNTGTQKSMENMQDVARLEKLPQPEPVRIQLLENYDVMDLCDQRIDVKVPGALYGFRFDKRPPCTTGPFVGATVTAAVVEGFGDWRFASDRYIANFEYVRSARIVPFYQVYTLVAVVNGADLGAVQAAAALLNPAALAAAAPARAK